MGSTLQRDSSYNRAKGSVRRDPKSGRGMQGTNGPHLNIPICRLTTQLHANTQKRAMTPQHKTPLSPGAHTPHLTITPTDTTQAGHAPTHNTTTPNHIAQPHLSTQHKETQTYNTSSDKQHNYTPKTQHTETCNTTTCKRQHYYTKPQMTTASKYNTTQLQRRCATGLT